MIRVVHLTTHTSVYALVLGQFFLFVFFKRVVIITLLITITSDVLIFDLNFVGVTDIQKVC